MASQSPNPDSPYKLHHTPLTKNPYITLPLSLSRSLTPIHLTNLYTTDAPTMVTLITHPSVSKELISIPSPYTLASAEWWITHTHSGKGDLPLLALRSGDPESGELIGSVSLAAAENERIKGMKALSKKEKEEDEGVALGEEDEDEDGEENEYELGYYLSPEYQGRGIMKEAVRACVSWGREYYGVKTVTVSALEENQASRRVIEGIQEFVREKEEKLINWPEIKGGGRKKLLLWRWSV